MADLCLRRPSTSISSLFHSFLSSSLSSRDSFILLLFHLVIRNSSSSFLSFSYLQKTNLFEITCSTTFKRKPGKYLIFSRFFNFRFFNFTNAASKSIRAGSFCLDAVWESTDNLHELVYNL